MRGNNSIISKPTPCEYVLKTYFKKKTIHYYFANKEAETNWDHPVSRRRTPTKTEWLQALSMLSAQIQATSTFTSNDRRARTTQN